uniref:Myosin motor domain-containing protein n=1 Tax=Heterorhabditis bacteriophora TaxID=37862 RepID=A0A1I7XGT4_HETBA
MSVDGAGANRGRWQVTYPGTNDSCIVMHAKIDLSLTYHDKAKGLKTVKLPIPSDAKVNTNNSSCDTLVWIQGQPIKTQILQIEPYPDWNIRFAFSTEDILNAKNHEFVLYQVNVTAKYATMRDQFPDSEEDVHVYVQPVDLKNPPLLADTIFAHRSHSYYCPSEQKFFINKNVDEMASWVKSAYTMFYLILIYIFEMTVILSAKFYSFKISLLQVEAYKTSPSDTFDQREICPVDQRVTDMVPIIVGGCLAGLIVFTLVVYLVYRNCLPPEVLNLTNPHSHYENKTILEDDESSDRSGNDQSRPYDSKKIVGCLMLKKVMWQESSRRIKAEMIQEMNPPKFEKTEDMSNLTFLNDASVLYNLRSRYASMLIYTYSGLFCVVINPYKRLPIYTDSVARMFMGKRRTEMPPHLFAVSDEAYRNMLQNHENQSMLITGESGAGKTENTKKVIAYFAAVGASQQEQFGKKEGTGTNKVTLEDQIVQTNPVLEAFGKWFCHKIFKCYLKNQLIFLIAHSRHLILSQVMPKLLEITTHHASESLFEFTFRKRDGWPPATLNIMFLDQILTTSTCLDLLEKSRVIRQAPGERCYHIFYQVFSGYIPTLTKTLLLDKPIKDYWFIAQAELSIDGVNDKLTDEAFNILKFSSEEKMNCYKLVSAMMHMGNMKFKQRPREEQAEPDGTDGIKSFRKSKTVIITMYFASFRLLGPLEPCQKVFTHVFSTGWLKSVIRHSIRRESIEITLLVFLILLDSRFSISLPKENRLKGNCNDGSPRERKKLTDENFRVGLTKILQRNVRSWSLLRTWSWFKLYGKVKFISNCLTQFNRLKYFALIFRILTYLYARVRPKNWRRNTRFGLYRTKCANRMITSLSLIRKGRIKKRQTSTLDFCCKIKGKSLERTSINLHKICHSFSHLLTKESRQRADRARADQQAEYDELTDQLEEQARATTAQIELGKKKNYQTKLNNCKNKGGVLKRRKLKCRFAEEESRERQNLNNLSKTLRSRT